MCGVVPGEAGVFRAGIMEQRCRACQQEVAEGAKFCPVCGEPLASFSNQETVSYQGPVVDPNSVVSAAGGPRFTPGQVLAGRYRIVTLLGRGGMGEVYRADDLRLGQPVALKFLFPHLTHDPAWRARFHNEVRMARSLAHPHVCRVYDVGEVNGELFLSMEYIDGENLSSLLSRIGRLPEDKAIELARQLCLGLAAAHARGILHRDLKPHNIMIDGQGQVRITDFGLAGFAGSFQGADIRAGTPAYQAPEQAAGREVTVRSDLYALGLVLYEMFTGKRAFEALNRTEPWRARPEETPITPSSHVSGLNPQVEEIILRCLEKDPAQRPASALAVALALPGGDPLALALAAGQTPSPQVVAQSGGSGQLPVSQAAALLAAALVGLALVAGLNDGCALFRQLPGELSPRELILRSRQLLRELGYSRSPADTAWGLITDQSLYQYLQRRYSGLGRWQGLTEGELPVIYFWYRQSPHYLVQRLTPNDTNGWSMPGRILPNEPPLQEPGMVCLFWGLDGKLLEFHAVPPHRQEVPPPAVTPIPNWAPLLQAAGLQAAQLRSVPAQRVPPVYADQRQAWQVVGPSARQLLPLQVEAAAFQGQVVYFCVAPPEVRERLYTRFLPEGEKFIYDLFYTIIGILALPLGGWLAWRQWKTGQANLAGARRLFSFYVLVSFLGWLLGAKHVLSPQDEVALLAGMLGRVLVEGVTLGLAYLALEPWVRRHRPWGLIGWSRLLQGNWHDPLVARAVLLGIVGGTGSAVVSHFLHALPGWLGYPADYQPIWDATFSEGLADVFLEMQYSLQVALRDFFFFFLLSLLLRRDLWAVPLTLAIWCLPYYLPGEYRWLEGLVNLCFYGLGLLLLLRFGFLTYVIYNFTDALLKDFPVTWEWSAWYGGIAAGVLLLLAALAAGSMYGACRGHLRTASNTG
jgi:predicted Ser/Thr protein kinase